MVGVIDNKIRVLQQRAYGNRDDRYLKLKFIAAFCRRRQNALKIPTLIRVDPFLIDRPPRLAKPNSSAYVRHRTDAI